MHGLLDALYPQPEQAEIANDAAGARLVRVLDRREIEERERIRRIQAAACQQRYRDRLKKARA